MVSTSESSEMKRPTIQPVDQSKTKIAGMTNVTQKECLCCREPMGKFIGSGFENVEHRRLFGAGLDHII